MSEIHATAVVASDAEIGEGVTIGPFSVVGPRVRLGDGTTLLSHVVVDGVTTVGAGATIYPFAAVGLAPQDTKYKGEESELVIGDNVTVRENVTLNPGTTGGGLITRVGNNCLLMAGSHVAHDCQVADNVILVNNATLAGHVEVGEHAIVGGLAAVHQFVRIGKHAMIGGLTGVENDVIPYGMVIGNRAHLSGLNVVGMKRRGFDRSVIHELRNAYRILFGPSGTMQDRLGEVSKAFGANATVMEIVEFIRADSSRAICQPRPERAV